MVATQKNESKNPYGPFPTFDFASSGDLIICQQRFINHMVPEMSSATPKTFEKT